MPDRQGSRFAMNARISVRTGCEETRAYGRGEVLRAIARCPQKPRANRTTRRRGNICARYATQDRRGRAPTRSSIVDRRIDDGKRPCCNRRTSTSAAKRRCKGDSARVSSRKKKMAEYIRRSLQAPPGGSLTAAAMWPTDGPPVSRVGAMDRSTERVFTCAPSFAAQIR